MWNLRVRAAMLGSCLLASSAATLIFYLATSANPQYSPTDIYLGSVWTFVLSTIISSPLLIPRIRRKIGQ
ncbi:MAG: hypothetical protein HYU39_03635 [Thaumarchaeota archaeon]|nr:hypothetical protein [Nitrososphaerota archaeon]